MRQGIPKILVTGGAGFIGSEFVRQACQKNQKIVVVDNLSYAGDFERLKRVRKKITFYKADITDFNKLNSIFKKERPSSVVHFAAETHVDRSILDANPFIKANITGTQNLITASLLHKVRKFIHISTDEVYGQSIKGKFKENAPLKPRNPYAATKAAGEFLVRAAIETYGFPALIVRPSNNYGPWQYPEKFVPVILAKALNDEKIPVYGRGRQIREWLYVTDCAKAILFLLKKGKTGEMYNIGSYFEQNNLKTATTLLKYLNKPSTLIQFVKDRPGHDFRYSVDCSKLFKLGWRPKVSFKKGIQRTIQWYMENDAWIDKKRKTLKAYWKNVYHV
ncbi:MAG TPA: dTDP-glucose 4,6-dehydratase [Candidatus Omnitrophota bacterium]|nr:dTDP-glucose 4,6-dehydratase [Candidatus Omnitrophota bacterium]